MPAVASPTATHREGDRALFGLFVGLLAWAPIPLGSNRPWSWALLEITIFALCAAWTIQWLRGRVAINGDFKIGRAHV